MKGESRVEAIVYTSNTGSAAQYAEMLAKETGLAAYSLDEARGKVPADSEVIYLGWVMAGTVKGYATAAKRYIVRAVCAVGMTRWDARQKAMTNSAVRLLPPMMRTATNSPSLTRKATKLRISTTAKTRLLLSPMRTAAKPTIPTMRSEMSAK